MNIIQTEIPGVLILEPKVLGDERGFFLESYNKKTLHDIGITYDFVQDNHSRSIKNVLRGLHYQLPPKAQGKLVRVLVGAIFDVVVDIRKDSPTLGKWVSVDLSAENKKMLWIPPGFAHGFLAISEVAEVFYKTTDFYAPDYERSLLWNDVDLAINWPSLGQPWLSDKDQVAKPLCEAELI